MSSAAVIFPLKPALAAVGRPPAVSGPITGILMPKVTLYTTRFCPYCAMAKRLLTQKGVSFEEIDVGGNPSLRAQMTSKANGHRTVPQIWIGDTHVGGCRELYQLDDKGELDALLAS